MNPKVFKLAQQANIKYRTWARASDKALEPYASDAAVQRSVTTMHALTQWLHEHDEVRDFQDGETFSVIDDEHGYEYTFRWTRKGDPKPLGERQR